MAREPHVLIVDDDLELVESLRAVLEAEGYRVTAEADGYQALEWLTRHDAPTVILLDLRLPTMNGWTVWGRVRFLREAARVPVLIISGDAVSHERARSVGAAGYLAKPFSADALLAKLDQILHPTRQLDY